MTKEQKAAIGELIWDFYKSSNDIWERNPTASSPFYGHSTLIRQIECIVENKPSEDFTIPHYTFPGYSEPNEQFKSRGEK